MSEKVQGKSVIREEEMVNIYITKNMAENLLLMVSNEMKNCEEDHKSGNIDHFKYQQTLAYLQAIMGIIIGATAYLEDMKMEVTPEVDESVTSQNNEEE